MDGMDSGCGRAESGQPRPQGSAPYAPGPLTHSHTKTSGLLGVRFDENSQGLHVGVSWKNVQEMDYCCCLFLTPV